MAYSRSGAAVKTDTSGACWNLLAHHWNRSMSRASHGIDHVRWPQSFLNSSRLTLCRQSLYRAYPTAWIFLSCPPDPSVRCISPGFYAVIGASAMLGGVTRMTSASLNYSIPTTLVTLWITVSLVVILFEVCVFLSCL